MYHNMYHNIMISNCSYPPPWPYPSPKTIAGKTTTITHSGKIILRSQHNAVLRETLWEMDFHRLDWFGPAALIYTWFRQSMENWTCHPESPLRHGWRDSRPSRRPCRGSGVSPLSLLLQLSCVAHTLSDLEAACS